MQCSGENAWINGKFTYVSKLDVFFQAYIQMIRNAENFLYIENQYFLGSAYAWLSDVETNADHTIPAEIAQKVKLPQSVSRI